MKQTERRSLFGKTYPLLCFRCKHRIPHLPKAKSKGVPNQPFYRNLTKEIKKTADIPMMTALQRKHSRNSFKKREAIDTPPATSFARLRQKHKRAASRLLCTLTPFQIPFRIAAQFRSPRHAQRVVLPSRYH